MRGEAERPATLLLGLTPDGFVPEAHPLRRIEPLFDAVGGQVAVLSVSRHLVTAVHAHVSELLLWMEGDVGQVVSHRRKLVAPLCHSVTSPPALRGERKGGRDPLIVPFSSFSPSRE